MSQNDKDDTKDEKKTPLIKKKSKKKKVKQSIDYEALLANSGDQYDANQPHIATKTMSGQHQIPSLLQPTPINFILVLSAMRMQQREQERLHLLPIATYVNRLVYMARFCAKEDPDILYSDDPTLLAPVSNHKKTIPIVKKEPIDTIGFGSAGSLKHPNSALTIPPQTLPPPQSPSSSQTAMRRLPQPPPYHHPPTMPSLEAIAAAKATPLRLNPNLDLVTPAGVDIAWEE